MVAKVWCSVMLAVVLYMFSDCAEKSPSNQARDAAAAAMKLWDESVRLVQLTTDEIHPLVR